MRAEFNNRVELQRKVLKIVNSKKYKTQLCGLSMPALQSWITNNNITEINLKNSLYNIAEKLFFIANKSQDQITDEYKNLQLSIKKEIQFLEEQL